MAIIKNLTQNHQYLFSRSGQAPSDVNQSRFGEGQRIYFFDDGLIAEVGELQGRVSHGLNPFNQGPTDHATMVACVAAGTENGLATKAQVISVPYHPSMDHTQIRAQFQWIIDQEAGKVGPFVVCGTITPMVQEHNVILQSVIDAGGVICWAAGEAGNAGLPYPASYENIIACCAVDQQFRKIDASNYSPSRYRQLYALGLNVKTTKADGSGTTQSGTSFATPAIAAIAAMWCEQLAWYGPHTTGSFLSHHIVQAMCYTGVYGFVSIPQPGKPDDPEARLAWAGWRITGAWQGVGVNPYLYAQPDVSEHWGGDYRDHFRLHGMEEGRGYLEDGND